MTTAHFPEDPNAPVFRNELDDSTGLPAPCQPIGCDAGRHIPGCLWADMDDDDPDDGCGCGHPECGAC